MKPTLYALSIVFSLFSQALFAEPKQAEPLSCDVLIIGSGPAGLTAGMYAARAKLDTIIIEGDLPGGQLMKTTTVENWPGETAIFGPDLIEKMTTNAAIYGCSFISETVIQVDVNSYPFEVMTNKETKIVASSIILATGSKIKKLNCPGEEEYFGKGIAVCATCDAPFYDGLDVIVVGTGGPALAEIEHLTHYAKKITVVEIKDTISSKDAERAKILQHPKVTLYFNTTVTTITGDGETVTGVTIENKQTGESTALPVDGVFVAIGLTPNSQLFKDKLQLLPNGCIYKAPYSSQTSISGIFTAGTVSDPFYQQAITCAAQGCMAALDAQKFLTGYLTHEEVSRHWRHHAHAR